MKKLDMNKGPGRKCLVSLLCTRERGGAREGGWWVRERGKKEREREGWGKRENERDYESVSECVQST